ncbi:MAG: hypothetical protein M3O09_19390 [Acidobacteriota bacterium]|nr:hypothetical protein [Acidobacteriota bacterium]
MSLPMERWTVYSSTRMVRIDAELKEKLAPFGASRSERFRFAYDLAFAIVCGDRTNAMVAAILSAYQETKSIHFSHQPQISPATGGKGAATSGIVAPIPIKGFQGGTHYEFESLLRHAAGMN